MTVSRAEGGFFAMRFDDNHAPDEWREVADIFESVGARCSFAVVAVRLAPDQVACLRELAARGHEVMDHTAQHAFYRIDCHTVEDAAPYRELPFVDHVKIGRIVFCRPDCDFDDPGNFRFKGVIRAGVLHSDDPDFIKRARFSMKIYVSGSQTFYGLGRNCGEKEFRRGPDQKVSDFWGTLSKANEPEGEMIALAPSAVRPSAALCRAQAAYTRMLFERHRLPLPKTWVQPGGWDDWMDWKVLSDVYGGEFGYVAADCRADKTPPARRTADWESLKRRWSFVPLSGLLDRPGVVEDIFAPVAEAMREDRPLAYISHLRYGGLPGGRKEFMDRLRAFARRLKDANVSCRTYSAIAESASAVATARDERKPSPPSSAVFGAPVRLPGSITGGACCVETDGRRLYVGGREALAVYDIASDPLHPKLLGECPGVATARQIVVREDIAYFTARANGLWIVDCRTPSKPSVLGHYPSTVNATGLEISGDVAIIGGSMSGIEFIDISDPRRPRQIRLERLDPVESQSVACQDGILYSGEWRGQCVSIWDIRDLAAPKRLALSPLMSNGDGVWPAGRLLYAMTGFGAQDKRPGARPRPGQMGLEIHDVVAPAHPKRVGRVDFDYCQAGPRDMWIVRVAGSRAWCAATYGGLYAVDVSDPASPRVLDRWLPEGPAQGRNRRCVASVAVGEGAVYVAGYSLGAWVLPAQGARTALRDRGVPPKNTSYRTPRSPMPEGFYRWLPEGGDLEVNVTGVAVHGDICYAAAGLAGLRILKLSESGITELRQLPIRECQDVSIAGNRLFVACGIDGWRIYDIVAPTELREIGHIPDAGARDVYAYGDGTRWVGFNQTVYDISDLDAPRPLVKLVNQARYNKFLSPDIFGGRWAAGNTALKCLMWGDLSSARPRPLEVRGNKTAGGGLCAFGDRAFYADKRKWALLTPGSIEVPELRAFPARNGDTGLPRWDGGTRISLSGMVPTAAIWDFADCERPKLVKFFRLPIVTDPAAFWRDTLVFPAHREGVLVPIVR